MAVLQRSTKVRMPVDKAEECWNDFATRVQNAPDAVQAKPGGNGKDPGTAYFTQIDDSTTEVTIQLDPEGLATGDEATLAQRVDSYLDGFKTFVEKR